MRQLERKVDEKGESPERLAQMVRLAGVERLCDDTKRSERWFGSMAVEELATTKEYLETRTVSLVSGKGIAFIRSCVFDYMVPLHV